MKDKKRMLLIGLAACLLAGCGNQEKTEPVEYGGQVAVETNQQPVSPTEAVEAMTTPAAEPTGQALPTEAGEPATEPSVTPEDTAPTAEVQAPTDAVPTGTPTSAPTPTAAETAAKGSFTESDYTVAVSGKKLTLRIDFTDYVNAIGTPTDITEGQSCLDSGYDTTYYYEGMTIYTMAEDGKHVIYDINIFEEGFTTSKGIVLGTSTEEDLYAAYGEPVTNARAKREYRIDDTRSVTFYVNDGIVTEIDIVDLNVA